MDRVGTAKTDRKIQTLVDMPSSFEPSMASEQNMAAAKIQRNIEELEGQIWKLFAIARNNEHGPPDTVCNDILRLSVPIPSLQISFHC
jgi:hypothetical protein